MFAYNYNADQKTFELLLHGKEISTVFTKILLNQIYLNNVLYLILNLRMNI